MQGPPATTFNNTMLNGRSACDGLTLLPGLAIHVIGAYLVEQDGAGEQGSEVQRGSCRVARGGLHGGQEEEGHPTRHHVCHRVVGVRGLCRRTVSRGEQRGHPGRARGVNAGHGRLREGFAAKPLRRYFQIHDGYCAGVEGGTRIFKQSQRSNAQHEMPTPKKGLPWYQGTQGCQGMGRTECHRSLARSALPSPHHMALRRALSYLGACRLPWWAVPHPLSLGSISTPTPHNHLPPNLDLPPNHPTTQPPNHPTTQPPNHAHPVFCAWVA